MTPDFWSRFLAHLEARAGEDPPRELEILPEDEPPPPVQRPAGRIIDLTMERLRRRPLDPWDDRPV